MPITGGKYVSPTWENGSAPALNAAELQAMTNTIANNQDAQGTITLTTNWIGNGPYTQNVTVSGATVTATKRVTLTPSGAQLQQLLEDGVATLQTENNNGTITVYAIGNPPSVQMTIACTVSEVV